LAGTLTDALTKETTQTVDGECAALLPPLTARLYRTNG
jgi:hypothetical protein